MEFCCNVTESVLLLGDARAMLDPVAVQPKKKLIVQFNFSLEKRKQKGTYYMTIKTCEDLILIEFSFTSHNDQIQTNFRILQTQEFFFSNHKVH